MADKENMSPLALRQALRPVGSSPYRAGLRQSTAENSPGSPTRKPVDAESKPPPAFDLEGTLAQIESQTKQTGIDVGQLWERSKNNNNFLQKLVAEIAAYANEVTTEGNATKNDIHNIVAKLDALSELIKTPQPEIVAKLDSLHQRDNKDIAELVARLGGLNTEKQTEKQTEKPADSGSKTSDTILEQQKTISKQQATISEQAAKIAEFERVSGSLDALTMKYKQMSEAYTEKYAEFEALHARFVALESEADDVAKLAPSKPRIASFSALKKSLCEPDPVPES
ncbi:hypothetical protein DICA1_F01156 [Diutina catenulata]